MRLLFPTPVMLSMLVLSPFVVGCSNSHFSGAPDSGVASDLGAPSADHGVTGDWTMCRQVGECQLRANTCCEPCGESDASAYDSVNVSFLDVHQMEVCPIPQPCPRCATFRPPELQSICSDAGRCEVYDVREDDAMVACTSGAECTLIPPTCCDCSGAYIAVRADRVSDYQSLVCDPTIDCACEPPEPVDLFAVCLRGRCEAVPPL